MTTTTLPSKKQSAETSALKLETISKFQVAYEGCQALADDIAQIKIIDEGSLAIAMDQAKAAKGALTKVEDLRKKLKEPVLTQGKMIDAVAKELVLTLQNEYEALRTRITKYEASRPKEEPKSDLDKVKEYYHELTNLISTCSHVQTLSPVFVQYIKNIDYSIFGSLHKQAEKMIEFARAYGKLRKEEIETGKTFLLEKIAVNTEAIEFFKTLEADWVLDSPVTPEIQVAVPTQERWTFEIVSMRDLPLFFVQANESAIREYIKDKKEKLKDGEVIHGVRFFKEKTIVIKA